MTAEMSVPLPDPKPGHHWQRQSWSVSSKADNTWTVTFKMVPDFEWSDEQVDSAAKAIYDNFSYHLAWHETSTQDVWRGHARAALDAAAKAGA